MKFAVFVNWPRSSHVDWERFSQDLDTHEAAEAHIKGWSELAPEGTRFDIREVPGDATVTRLHPQ